MSDDKIRELEHEIEDLKELFHKKIEGLSRSIETYSTFGPRFPTYMDRNGEIFIIDKERPSGYYHKLYNIKWVFTENKRDTSEATLIPTPEDFLLLKLRGWDANNQVT